VCVRITNINDVDLSWLTFDFDLTMAFVIASPDGTVHHRYGGRDDVSPMNLETLIDVMREGAETHREYLRSPSPPPATPPLRIRELVAKDLTGQMRTTNGCYHCHHVREAVQYAATRRRAWDPSQYWIYPTAERFGVVLDQRRQNQVQQVRAGSPAMKAGITIGDRLHSLGGKRVLTKYDVQFVLDALTGGPVALPFALDRDGRSITGTLALAGGWKVSDPHEYDWRVNNVYTEHMRKYLPAPGVVGERLTGSALTAIGLPADGFALRVKNTNYGTHLSGIRRGDIILGIGGRTNFASDEDFYRTCELSRLARKDIEVNLLRSGAKMRLMVTLGYDSYTSVERSPEVMLGFLAQELAAGRGLRVGNVVAGSGAERAGLRLGDRIRTVDGKRLMTFAALQEHLDARVPGDTISFEVLRGDSQIRVAFSLVDKEQRASKLAFLSAVPKQNGQELTLTVTIAVPTDCHVYSANQPGFGLPTKVTFRGRGFELLGALQEPPPRAVQQEGLETMWIHDGDVALSQCIRITDIAAFQMVLEVYAQVCDASSCHEFRAAVSHADGKTSFLEFTQRTADIPIVAR